MPIKDEDARRAYFRDYMRQRRAGGAKPKPKRAASAQPAASEELIAARQEIQRLRNHVSALEGEKEMLTKRVYNLSKQENVEAYKRLQTANKNLRERLSYMELRGLRNQMPATTFRAIANCLHSDKQPPSVQARTEAMQLFNAWRSSGKAKP